LSYKIPFLGGVKENCARFENDRDHSGRGLKNQVRDKGPWVLCVRSSGFRRKGSRVKLEGGREKIIVNCSLLRASASVKRV